MNKKELIYCDWCGKSPYYISIYEERGDSKETFLCRECYNMMKEEEG